MFSAIKVKTMNKKIVWGVIGAGSVCEVKSVPAMYKLPDSQVKIIMRRTAIAAEDFAKRHGIHFWTQNVDVLFEDKEINAVYIATPPDTHAYYTQKAAQAGKIVYVEKPMARNYAECLDMISACEETNIPLFVAYYRRALAHFLRAKELIDLRHLGNIQEVDITFNRSLRDMEKKHPEKIWRLDPKISGGGYFHDLASHQLDLLDFFLGPVIKAKGTAQNISDYYNVPDIVQAELLFKDNIIAKGYWNFSCSENEVKDEIFIKGDKGYITFSTFAHTKIRGFSDSLGIINESYQLPQHIQECLIKTIILEIQGNGTCPSTGLSAARTSKVMDIICNYS